MPAGEAYASTEVAVSKSQEEVRGLLLRFGADQFSFGEGRGWAGIEFVHAEHLVRIRCPVRVLTDEDFTVLAKQRRQSIDKVRAAGQEQELRRVWRVLVWTVKARVVAVEEGLETFEQSFLAHLVDPATQRTLWQLMQEPLEAGVMRIGGSGLRELGSGRGR